MRRKAVGAGILGVVASQIWWRSGLATVVHELGHCGSGLALYRYLPGKGPMMQADQLERLCTFFSRGSWRDLRAYLSAGCLNGGASWVHHGIPRAGLSYDARRALAAISGSLPQLTLDLGLVGVGRGADDECVAVGCFGAALGNHIYNSAYPIDGYLRLIFSVGGSLGHDFVNFATHAAQTVRLSPILIAGMTAVVWSGSVPAAIGTELARGLANCEFSAARASLTS